MVTNDSVLENEPICKDFVAGTSLVFPRALFVVGLVLILDEVYVVGRVVDEFEFVSVDALLGPLVAVVGFEDHSVLVCKYLEFPPIIEVKFTYFGVYLFLKRVVVAGWVHPTDDSVVFVDFCILHTDTYR